MNARPQLRDYWIVILLILMKGIGTQALAQGDCEPEVGLCKPADFAKKRDKSETEKGCFFSKSMKKNVCYTVSFPKGYPFERPAPYVVYLHGRDDRGLKKNRQFQAFCAECEERTKKPVCLKVEDRNFLVVAPSQSEHTYWKNSVDGNAPVEDMVSTDLLAHIESHKDHVAVGDSASRGLTGISMGGHGATYLGMKNPDLFPQVYAISPIFRAEDSMVTKPGFDDSYGFGYDSEFRKKDPLVLLKANGGFPRGSEFVLEIAKDDPLLIEQKHTQEFFQTAKEMYPTKVNDEGTGAHSLDFWCGALERSMDFFSRKLKAGPSPASSGSRAISQPRKALK